LSLVAPDSITRPVSHPVRDQLWSAARRISAALSGEVPAAVVFSLKAFLAALLALFIAFWLGLDEPRWALLTVYVVAQPESGLVRAKSFFRLLGTFAGALASIALCAEAALSAGRATDRLNAAIGTGQLTRSIAVDGSNLLDHVSRAYLPPERDALLVPGRRGRFAAAPSPQPGTQPRRRRSMYCALSSWPVRCCARAFSCPPCSWRTASDV
jgi:hypothetical protein